MTGKPKFRQLLDAEKAIGQRVAQYRKSNLLNQWELAGSLGISRDQLASVEAGRVPLTTEAALTLASEFNVNLMWLAEGHGAPFRPIKIPDELIEKAKDTKYFRPAYDTVLHSFFWSDFKKVTKRHLAGRYTPEELTISRVVRRITLTPEATLRGLIWSLEESCRMMPPDLREKFFIWVGKHAAKFKLDHDKAIRDFVNKHGLESEIIKSISAIPNRGLTEAATSEKLDAVKAQLPSLLERLNRATKESGRMSALADFLGVPLASVSRWLSGKREPGGEITLKMLRWVEQQERQK